MRGHALSTYTSTHFTKSALSRQLQAGCFTPITSSTAKKNKQKRLYFVHQKCLYFLHFKELVTESPGGGGAVHKKELTELNPGLPLQALLSMPKPHPRNEQMLLTAAEEGSLSDAVERARGATHTLGGGGGGGRCPAEAMGRLAEQCSPLHAAGQTEAL